MSLNETQFKNFTYIVNTVPTKGLFCCWLAFCSIIGETRTLIWKTDLIASLVGWSFELNLINWRKTHLTKVIWPQYMLICLVIYVLTLSGSLFSNLELRSQNWPPKTPNAVQMQWWVLRIIQNSQEKVWAYSIQL